MLSEKAKKRVGEKNSFYNKHHSEETKEKLRKQKGVKVICDGILFDSIKECAKYANVNPTSLRKYLRGLQKTLRTTDKDFKLIGD